MLSPEQILACARLTVAIIGLCAMSHKYVLLEEKDFLENVCNELMDDKPVSFNELILSVALDVFIILSSTALGYIAVIILFD